MFSIFSLDISGFFVYSSSAVIGTIDLSLIFIDSENKAKYYQSV